MRDAPDNMLNLRGTMDRTRDADIGGQCSRNAGIGGQSAKDADIHRDTTLHQRLQIRLFWTFYWEIPSLHRIQEIHVGNYLQLEIALSIFNLRGFGSRKGRLLRIR